MIRLRTLGARDLRGSTRDLRGSNGKELRGALARPSRAALLVYLAIAHPRGFHRRDTLVSLFWPEHDQEHARNALSQAVHFLRRSLAADLPSVALATSWVWTPAEGGRRPCVVDERRAQLHTVDLTGEHRSPALLHLQAPNCDDLLGHRA